MGNFGKREDRGGDRRFSDDRRPAHSGFGAREYGRPHQAGGFAKKGWDDRGGNRDRERGEITLHQAVCSECGKNCEVPFRPNGTKPVYCKECFGAMKGNGPTDAPRHDRKDFGGSDRSTRSARPAEATTGNTETKKLIEALSTKIESLTRTVDALVAKISATPHTHTVVENTQKKTEDKKTVEKVAAKKTEKKPVKKVAPTKRKK